MKTITSKFIAASLGLFLAATHSVKADILVYDNSTTNTLQSLSFANGWTIGNEILLAGPNTITSFEFEVFNPTNILTGTVTMTIALYNNTGGLVGGYPSPAALPFWSDSFIFAPPSFVYQPYYPYDGTGGYGLTVIESGLSLSVPSDFTLAITISGLSGPDALGLELYNSVTVGNSYNDYWFDNGSGWQLLQTPSGGPNNFGARFYVVPEPSTVCLGVLGGALLSFVLRRRRAS